MIPTPEIIDRFEAAVRANSYRTATDATEAEYQAAKADLSRALYAAPTPQPVSVKVKLLDWRPEPPYHVARVFGNVYAVEAWAGGATLSGVGGRCDFKTLSEAKAAAQADYESRIRSALSSPVEGGTEKEEPIECLTCNGTGHEARHQICRDCDDMAAALEPFADQSEFWSDQVSDKTPLLEKDNLKVGDVRRAAKALDKYRRAIRTASPSPAAEIEALRVENERLKEALWPFAKVAEKDIGETEHEADLFVPAHAHNRAPRLVVGDFRRAHAVLRAKLSQEEA